MFVSKSSGLFTLTKGVFSGLSKRLSSMLSVTECQKFLVIDDQELKFDKSKFPLVWIRDNCNCSHCYHPTVNRRIIDWNTFPFDATLDSYEFDQLSGNVELKWSDGHESHLPLKFFESHKFEPETVENYKKKNYRLEKIPWSKHDRDFKIPRYNLEEILHNDDEKELKSWLEGLSTFGLAILENTKLLARPNLMTEFVRKMFGFCKETHYGRDFLIQNRVTDITNVAYQNSNLQPHIDLPYYEYVPGVTLLHFYKQSVQGGLSTLVDALNITERMKRDYPEEYKILSTVPVNWVDKGIEKGLKFHKIFIKPVIGLKDGKFDRFNFSVPQRDSYFSIGDPDMVYKWYSAMKIFMDIARNEIMAFKVNQDDFLTFDNIRLMHGRTEYQAKEDRTLVGCYMDWDEIYSKYRAIDDRY